MKMTIKAIALMCALTLTAAGYAAAPVDAPADANGLCKDGSYSTNATKKGACKGHKGVKQWWGTASAKPAKKSDKSGKTEAGSESAATPAAAPMAAPSAAAKPAPNPSTATMAKAAAPGGAPDKVWVNTESKVYHCPGDHWYGTTKQGEYMSEAEATAKGYRADRGKACK